MGSWNNSPGISHLESLPGFAEWQAAMMDARRCSSAGCAVHAGQYRPEPRTGPVSEDHMTLITQQHHQRMDRMEKQLNQMQQQQIEHQQQQQQAMEQMMKMMQLTQQLMQQQQAKEQMKNQFK